MEKTLSLSSHYTDHLEFEVENTTYDTIKVDLFSQIEPIPAGIKIHNTMLSYYGPNKVTNNYEFSLKAFLAQKFEYQQMRLYCDNPYQFEQPFTRGAIGVNGTTYTSVFMPFIKYEPEQNISSMVEVTGGHIDYKTYFQFDLLPRTKMIVSLTRFVGDAGADARGFATVFPYLSAIKIHNTSDKSAHFKTDFTSADIDKINAAGVFKVNTPSYSYDYFSRGRMVIHKIYAPGINGSLLFNLCSEHGYNHAQFHTGGKWCGPFEPKIIYSAKTLDGDGPCPEFIFGQKQTLDVEIPAGKYVYLCVDLQPTLQPETINKEHGTVNLEQVTKNLEPGTVNQLAKSASQPEIKNNKPESFTGTTRSPSWWAATPALKKKIKAARKKLKTVARKKALSKKTVKVLQQKVTKNKGATKGPRQHFFHSLPPAGSLCGIIDHRGLIYNTGKAVTCKRCLAIKNKNRKK